MAEKIRVLHIISDTNIGGAGHYLINYLKFHDRERFAPSVALPRGSLLVPKLQELGTPLIELDGLRDKSFDPSAIRLLREAVRQAEAQIVHTHGALSGRIAARQVGAKVVFTRHCAFPVPGYLKKGPGRWLNKAVNERYADRIIAISPAAAETLVESGIDPGRIDTMMNGVEPLERRSPAECAALRRRFGLREGVFTAGILARLEPYKGHRYILEAASLLQEQGRDFQVLIAGSGSCEEELKALTRQLRLENRVKFPGFVQDVAGALSLLDVQLNASSVTETSSLSILEGFSIGVPAVASRCSGNPYLVDEGEEIGRAHV